jgi:MFS transporter, AAHS family, 4-hydroxybenzoate transporter
VPGSDRPPQNESPSARASGSSHIVDLGQILDEGRWGGRQKLFVFLTALAIVFDGVDNQLIGIAVPSLMSDWSLARGAFAPILASGMIGMMLGGAIAGIIGDRMGASSL